LSPVFLSLSEVLDIHQDQITTYGGRADIRDLGLLNSALGMPSAMFGGQFLHSDIFEMAAAYLFHIVRNHPFVDGNKRVGVVTAIVFLILNGIDFQSPEDDLTEMVLDVASGEMSKSDIAVFLRQWSRPLDS
jgi:death-on-curing protein